MNQGFIYRAPEPEDYRDNGKFTLAGQPLTNGQWDDHLPTDEMQALHTETNACASFGTLNSVEMLERRVYGAATNWSDRFLAKISGTTPRGNDPHTVAEALRKSGNVYETDWPFSRDVDTMEKFYANPPYDLTVQAQVKFKGKYNFGHQYIARDHRSMMNALMFSPLGVDVYAWRYNPRKDVYEREGNPSGHWVSCYGFVEGQYWKILDTYYPFKKKLAWDYGFTMVKEYTLDRQVLQNSLWDRAIKWFQSLHPDWS